jgi:hypothetical protein
MAPGDLLTLQRRAGNRAVGGVLARRTDKSVTVELRQPPKWVKPPRALEGATAMNVRLAEEIDALDGVEPVPDAELVKLRNDITLQLSRPGNERERDGLLLKLRAIEFVVSRRRQQAHYEGATKRETSLAPVVPEWGRFDEVRHDPARRRAWTRWLVEEGVRKTGSFKRAIDLQQVPKDVLPDIDAIKEEAERFGHDFLGQARATAERLLDGSQAVIDRTLTEYGVRAGDVHSVAADVFKTESKVPGFHMSAQDAAELVVKRMQDPSREAEVDAPARQAKREDLARTVGHLKELQAKLAEAKRQKYANATPAKGPIDWSKAPAAATAYAQARDALTAAWFAAEKTHPLLSSYRREQKPDPDDKDSVLGKIDLGALDTAPVDKQMTAVIARIVPTVAHLGRARALLKEGRLSPVALPAVVALTRTNMFIPEGSIRDGVVNDLVAAERKKRDSTLVTVASYALALITLLPTGGAAAILGLASGGLAAYSALADIEHYDEQTILVDTDLDKARALSQEEPSLSGLAWDLVALGFEFLPLYHAWAKTRELRGIVKRGLDARDIVDELNRLGKRAKRPIPDLGDKTLAEIQAVEHAEQAAVKAPPTAPAPEPPAAKPPSKPASAKETAKPKYEPQSSKKKSGKGSGRDKSVEPEGGGKGAPRPLPEPMADTDIPAPPPKDPRAQRGRFIPSSSVAQVEQRVGDALSTLSHGTSPVGPRMLDLQRAITSGSAQEKLLIEHWYDYVTLRSREVMRRRQVALWTAAARRQAPTGMTLEHFLGDQLVDVTGELQREHLLDARPFRDLFYASDTHGSLTHGFQEWVLNEERGGNAGRRLRQRIGQAEGPNVIDSSTGAEYPFWRAMYNAFFDETTPGHINRPEDLGQILQEFLGFPRWERERP